MIQGLGDDGHTASLYPGTPALKEEHRLVVANYVPQRPGSNYRLTITFPVLNSARQLMFLVSGHKKANALRTVLIRESERPSVPARNVKPKPGKLLWLVDEAAASSLR